MPMEDRKPPMIMMGLQPYLFTRILLMGPGGRTHNIIEYIIYYIDVTYFIYIYIYIYNTISIIYIIIIIIYIT